MFILEENRTIAVNSDVILDHCLQLCVNHDFPQWSLWWRWPDMICILPVVQAVVVLVEVRAVVTSCKALLCHVLAVPRVVIVLKF